MRRIKRHTHWRSAGLVLGLIALLLALGGTAYGKQENPNKTGAKFYGPDDYSPGHSSIGYQHEFIGQIICTSAPSADTPGGGGNFSLPFDNLPDGAAITKLTVYFKDEDPSEHLTFQPAFSKAGRGDVIEEFTAATSTDGGPIIDDATGVKSLDMTPTSPVPVDNANRRYFMGATFSACAPKDEEGIIPTLALDGVRVEYTLK